MDGVWGTKVRHHLVNGTGIEQMQFSWQQKYWSNIVNHVVCCVIALVLFKIQRLTSKFQE